ncbi:hypothetical protein [Alkalihalobacillus deserti]|uniref:hypothetical protein n=1 Tax=Alkalihalobacillus deserti TaxID=2879466 RepID=UPI001D13EB51|nr:hypothetical protein [Alkalihalobacillus deserti]
MKKFYVIFFLIFSVFTLVGCGNEQGEPIEEIEVEEENGQIEELEVEEEGEIFDREIVDN